MPARNALIVFVRAPRLGTVKTRLAAEIGDEAALGVYRRLAEHTISVAREVASADGATLRVWYAPSDAEEEVAEWLGSRLEYRPQPEGDLGERMHAAFEAAFAEGFQRVVIVGSDLPTLSAAIVRRAFSELGRGEVVLGPAEDGGYYLLGLARPRPRLFRDMPWGSDRVLGRTLEVLATEGIRPHLLQTLRDVDTAADLARGGG